LALLEVAPNTLAHRLPFQAIASIHSTSVARSQLLPQGPPFPLRRVLPQAGAFPDMRQASFLETLDKLSWQSETEPYHDENGGHHHQGNEDVFHGRSFPAPAPGGPGSEPETAPFQRPARIRLQLKTIQRVSSRMLLRAASTFLQLHLGPPFGCDGAHAPA